MTPARGAAGASAMSYLPVRSEYPFQPVAYLLRPWLPAPELALDRADAGHRTRLQVIHEAGYLRVDIARLGAVRGRYRLLYLRLAGVLCHDPLEHAETDGERSGSGERRHCRRCPLAMCALPRGLCSWPR